MLYVFSYENSLHESLDEAEQEALPLEVVKAMEAIESELMHSKDDRGEITEETGNESTRLNGMTDGSLEFDKSIKTRGSSYKSKSACVYDSFSEPGSQLPKQFSMSLIRTMQPAGSDFNLFKNVLHLLVICLSDLNAGTI